MSDMTRVAVLDDWQGVARGAADWAPLQRRAEVVFFSDAFADQDDAGPRQVIGDQDPVRKVEAGRDPRAAAERE